MIHYTKQERVEAVRRKMKELCPVCWQDTVILVVVMTIALDMGLLLQPVGADDSHAALIFVAGVLLVARYTNGYLYGIAASLTAAIVVNYAFLSPYYQFELQEPGYLLTFATLFLVSIVTSTLTTHIKEQEEIRIEAERERLRANLLRAVPACRNCSISSFICKVLQFAREGALITIGSIPFSCFFPVRENFYALFIKPCVCFVKSVLNIFSIILKTLSPHNISCISWSRCLRMKLIARITCNTAITHFYCLISIFCKSISLFREKFVIINLRFFMKMRRKTCPTAGIINYFSAK